MESGKSDIKVWLKVRVVSIYKHRINTYISKKSMVVSCVAVNCSNSRKNSPELSFERLPMLNEDNREIHERWLANVKRHSPLHTERKPFLFLF